MSKQEKVITQGKKQHKTWIIVFIIGLIVLVSKTPAQDNALDNSDRNVNEFTEEINLKNTTELVRDNGNDIVGTDDTETTMANDTGVWNKTTEAVVAETNTTQKEREECTETKNDVIVIEDVSIASSLNVISEVPAYNGVPYVIINENVPLFDDKEKQSVQTFENYSKLDSLGRCGIAYANISQEIMPTEERGEIGQVRPSGWHTVKYNDIIEGNYLYNRCHLIAFCLAGENANTSNLITGTRYLNVDGMLPFEMQVYDYLNNNKDKHVLYRVTPQFVGDELVARGVLMEAYSVEDQGNGIQFCIYAYNVQPGISINYANGDSEVTGEFLEEARNNGATSVMYVEDKTTAEVQALEEITTEASSESATKTITADYILNTNTHKFHRISCSSVKDMAEHNKKEFSGSRDEAIDMGYVPCKRCNP